MKNIQTRFSQNQEYPEIKSAAAGVAAWIKEYAKSCLFKTVFVTADLTAYGITRFDPVVLYFVSTYLHTIM